MRKTGLTLGKYAPFHKGHQFVIETALSEMNAVIVLIYDSPLTTRIPLNVRSNWIKTLYPEVRVIEAWDGPEEVGDTPEIKSMHEQYIRRILGDKKITHFYSSEFYGTHMSRALCAENRIVDPERRRVPVSGTRIRKNPFRMRDDLDPLVYRDLITNVVFLGAPSTGKSTIAAALAKFYDTRMMPEFGREYWEKHQRNRRLTPSQLVEIAQVHIEREEDLLYRSRRYLFTDTNALTTRIFSLYYHGTVPSRLEKLADKAASRYDLVFLCDTDMPYHDTWDRSGKVNREVFQKRIIADLETRKIPFFRLSGQLKNRVEKVKSILGKFHKYMNLIDLGSWKK